MRILHTIAGLGAHSGGTSTCAYELLVALNAGGVQADCLTLLPENPNERMLGNDAFIHAFPNDAKTPLGISRTLRRTLITCDYDLYHTNGLWLDVNHVTCVHARRQRRPYIISPHGMLYPQALSRSAWKKKLMLTLGHQRDIAEASCLHVTCEEEMRHCRTLGFRQPIAIIPNPVTIPDYLNAIIPLPQEEFRVGFLGRLHPIKNLESLIRAWATLQLPHGELLIMGSGEPAYEQSLHRLVAETNAQNVSFRGFVNGRAKYETLASLDVLCAPSHQENFGMSIAEALLVGTPTIASTGTPWEVLNTRACGWWCANDVGSLAAALNAAAALSPEERRAMGTRGQALIMSSFSSHRVAEMMTQFYQYILKGSSKPDFVYE